ncbi:MAG TPA: tetratricopeptide repeat protein [Opitutaceae bacterium]|nr:tetratricopeptide repeat protein [Opitutaceae bacterium]
MSKARQIWMGALVLAATLLAYFPALSAGFVWNDRDYVTSPALSSASGLARIWFQVGATEQYYPILHTAFWVEHRLWGDAAFGYHLLNILLHAASAVLLALILRRLFADWERQDEAAWLAAFVFALHPVCAESVAWISEQKNTLSTVFYLAAALAYLRFERRRSWRPYLLASALFALALLTKSVTATLPAGLLVVLWWRRGRLEWKRDVAPLLPWLAAGAAFGLFTAWVEKDVGGAKGAAYQLSLIERGLLAGRAAWFYLGKLLWPANLVFIYPRWHVSAAEAWQYLYPAAALALLAALWLLRRRWRGPLAGALFFVGSLFPVLGFLNVYAFIFSYVADHWQYLASLGVIVPAAAGAAAWLGLAPPRLRWPGRALLAGILALLGAQTWRESRGFHDMLTFYQTIIDRNPDAWMAHYNLGNELRSAGRTPEAIAHYERALQANADMPDAQTALGLALQAEGRDAEAEAHYEAALRLDPNVGSAQSNLGLALMKQGRGDEALGHFQAALRLQPGDVAARNHLANTLARMDGRLPEAIDQYEHSLQLRPDQPEVQNNLGIALLMLGRAPEAIGHFEAALRLDPTLARTHANLATALESVGRPREAAEHYAAARRLGLNVPPSGN